MIAGWRKHGTGIAQLLLKHDLFLHVKVSGRQGLHRNFAYHAWQSAAKSTGCSTTALPGNYPWCIYDSRYPRDVTKIWCMTDK